MFVKPIAWTNLDREYLQSALPAYMEHPTGSADELAEIAGRNCYQSWNRPNVHTATNEGYLANILNMGHRSVLEHASVSFFVSGVSRALLAEISRHRHLSFSVESQRFVDQAGNIPVIPPAIYNNTEAEGILRDVYVYTRDAYRKIQEILSRDPDQKRKQRNETARSVLPQATSVRMVVTGNYRAWMEVIEKRYTDGADAEIREFAKVVLRWCKRLAPNTFQFMEE